MAQQLEALATLAAPIPGCSQSLELQFQKIQCLLLASTGSTLMWPKDIQKQK